MRIEGDGEMESGEESVKIGALQRRIWILWNYVFANCRPCHPTYSN